MRSVDRGFGRVEAKEKRMGGERRGLVTASESPDGVERPHEPLAAHHVLEVRVGHRPDVVRMLPELPLGALHPREQRLAVHPRPAVLLDVRGARLHPPRSRIPGHAIQPWTIPRPWYPWCPPSPRRARSRSWARGARGRTRRLPAPAREPRCPRCDPDTAGPRSAGRPRRRGGTWVRAGGSFARRSSRRR